MIRSERGALCKKPRSLDGPYAHSRGNCIELLIIRILSSRPGTTTCVPSGESLPLAHSFFIGKMRV